MSAGNILRPWALTKGNKGRRPPAPKPGLVLGSIGERLDQAGLIKGLGWLPTSDQIEYWHDKILHRGVFDPARAGRREE